METPTKKLQPIPSAPARKSPLRDNLCRKINAPVVHKYRHRSAFPYAYLNNLDNIRKVYDEGTTSFHQRATNIRKQNRHDQSSKDKLASPQPSTKRKNHRMQSPRPGRLKLLKEINQKFVESPPPQSEEITQRYQVQRNFISSSMRSSRPTVNTQETQMKPVYSGKTPNPTSQSFCGGDPTDEDLPADRVDVMKLSNGFIKQLPASYRRYFHEKDDEKFNHFREIEFKKKANSVRGNKKFLHSIQERSFAKSPSFKSQGEILMTRSEKVHLPRINYPRRLLSDRSGLMDVSEHVSIVHEEDGLIQHGGSGVIRDGDEQNCGDLNISQKLLSQRKKSQQTAFDRLMNSSIQKKFDIAHRDLEQYRELKEQNKKYWKERASLISGLEPKLGPIPDDVRLIQHNG